MIIDKLCIFVLFITTCIKFKISGVSTFMLKRNEWVKRNSQKLGHVNVSAFVLQTWSVLLYVGSF